MGVFHVFKIVEIVPKRRTDHMIYLGCKNFSPEEDEHHTIHKTIWKNIDLSIKGLNSFCFWFDIVFWAPFSIFRIFLIENSLFAYWLYWRDSSSHLGPFSLQISYCSFVKLLKRLCLLTQIFAMDGNAKDPFNQLPYNQLNELYVTQCMSHCYKHKTVLCQNSVKCPNAELFPVRIWTHFTQCEGWQITEIKIEIREIF